MNDSKQIAGTTRRWAVPLLVMLAIGVAGSPCVAQPGAEVPQGRGRLTQDLSGYRWKLKQMRPGQGVREGLHELPPGDIETHVWLPARVPGDVYTDLWKAGVIDDPYFGRNSVKAQWVALDEWWYSIQFDVYENVEDRVVRLVFDGVDYSCDVWLNGHYLGRHEGAFSPFSFDVTDIVRTDPDWRKARNLLMVKLDPPPQVNSKVAGLKTPWFGDYWRDLIPFGIWRSVRLVSTGKVRVDDACFRSTLGDDGSADVHVEITLENHDSRMRSVELGITLTGENFAGDAVVHRVKAEAAPGKSTVETVIHLDKPRLWWPWDLGKPNLYRGRIDVVDNGRLLDRNETVFGIREIRMGWNPGFTRDEVSFPRTVFINGKRHFIRSACWGGPPDIFVGRTTPEKYRRLIELAKAANMNNIRIFGWHPPEVPEFYELCDRLGLTVWQDVIPLGTANIPQDEATIERIYQEAEAVVRERRNHPCLILLEGGEEAFLRAEDPPFTKRFLEGLGERIQRLIDLPYVPDSPLTCKNSLSVGYKPKEADHANAYFYSMGRWLMEDWIKTIDFPIIPELAITSVPSVESLRKFIPEDELWPPGPSWGHHWADLDRLRMQNFDTFGDERTESLEAFVEATQIAQGTIFQLAIEHVRRAKPKTSGIALCHFITYWPDMKWGIVDNYCRPKRSYEFVQRAYQPLLVSLDFPKRRWKTGETFTGKLWIVNDTYRTYGARTIALRVIDRQGSELYAQEVAVGDVPPDSARPVGDVQWPVRVSMGEPFFVELRLRDADGNVLSKNRYMLLAGDQEAARRHMQELGRRMVQRQREYNYGNYYRFFPQLIDAEDPADSDPVPRADGFDTRP